MNEAFLSIVAVEDTEDGAREIDSIDGDELGFKVTVDGELLIDNGRQGFYASGLYSLRDLIADRDEDSVRLELRVVWRESSDPHFPDCQPIPHDPVDCRGDSPEDHDPAYSPEREPFVLTGKLSVMPNKPRTPLRSVRIPDDLWDDATRVAAARGESVSDEIRAGLERYVKRNRKLVED